MKLRTSDFPPELVHVITHHTVFKNQILFQQGEQAQSIFWVQSGRLKLVSFTHQQMVIHYLVGAEESLAETALFSDTYRCTAIAEQPTQILSIPKQHFLNVLHQSSHFCEQYLAHLTDRFAGVKQLLELRSIRSARDRLLHYLTLQQQPGQSTILLNQSLKALALELGLSPEVLSRTFAQLEADRVLQRKKGRITFNQDLELS